MGTTITREDWLKALHEAGLHAGEDDQSAITIAEFAQMMDISRLAAERRLKALATAGKAARTRKRVTLADGRVMSCLAYRLVT